MNQIVWDRLARELKKGLAVTAQQKKVWNQVVQAHLQVGWKYGLSTQELES